MDYVIKNCKNVYIRLNKNGAPVTCVENEKTLFEELKARNILKCLPKTLKRLNFKIEAISDISKTKKILEKRIVNVENIFHLKILHVGLKSLESVETFLAKQKKENVSLLII